jgi:hypothetical protein
VDSEKSPRHFRSSTMSVTVFVSPRSWAPPVAAVGGRSG